MNRSIMNSNNNGTSISSGIKDEYLLARSPTSPARPPSGESYRPIGGAVGNQQGKTRRLVSKGETAAGGVAGNLEEGGEDSMGFSGMGPPSGGAGAPRRSRVQQPSPATYTYAASSVSAPAASSSSSTGNRAALGRSTGFPYSHSHSNSIAGATTGARIGMRRASSPLRRPVIPLPLSLSHSHSHSYHHHSNNRPTTRDRYSLSASTSAGGRAGGGGGGGVRRPSGTTTSTSNTNQSQGGDSRSSQFLLTVIPPTHLPHDPPHPRTSQACSGYGPPEYFRRGTLIPLYPTLSLQLAAIAREYGLPSTGGLVLYLLSVTDPSFASSGLAGEGGPRISEEAWQLLWGRLFDAEREERLLMLQLEERERLELEMEMSGMGAEMMGMGMRMEVGSEEEEEFGSDEDYGDEMDGFAHPPPPVPPVPISHLHSLQDDGVIPRTLRRDAGDSDYEREPDQEPEPHTSFSSDADGAESVYSVLMEGTSGSVENNMGAESMTTNSSAVGVLGGGTGGGTGGGGVAMVKSSSASKGRRPSDGDPAPTSSSRNIGRGPPPAPYQHSAGLPSPTSIPGRDRSALHQSHPLPSSRSQRQVSPTVPRHPHPQSHSSQQPRLSSYASHPSLRHSSRGSIISSAPSPSAGSFLYPTSTLSTSFGGYSHQPLGGAGYGSSVIVGKVEFDIDWRRGGRSRWYEDWVAGASDSRGLHSLSASAPPSASASSSASVVALDDLPVLTPRSTSALGGGRPFPLPLATASVATTAAGLGREKTHASNLLNSTLASTPALSMPAVSPVAEAFSAAGPISKSSIPQSLQVEPQLEQDVLIADKHDLKDEESSLGPVSLSLSQPTPDQPQHPFATPSPSSPPSFPPSNPLSKAALWAGAAVVGGATAIAATSTKHEEVDKEASDSTSSISSSRKDKPEELELKDEEVKKEVERYPLPRAEVEVEKDKLELLLSESPAAEAATSSDASPHVPDQRMPEPESDGEEVAPTPPSSEEQDHGGSNHTDPEAPFHLESEPLVTENEESLVPNDLTSSASTTPEQPPSATPSPPPQTFPIRPQMRIRTASGRSRVAESAASAYSVAALAGHASDDEEFRPLASRSPSMSPSSSQNSIKIPDVAPTSGFEEEEEEGVADDITRAYTPVEDEEMDRAHVGYAPLAGHNDTESIASEYGDEEDGGEEPENEGSSPTAKPKFHQLLPPINNLDNVFPNDEDTWRAMAEELNEMRSPVKGLQMDVKDPLDATGLGTIGGGTAQLPPSAPAGVMERRVVEDGVDDEISQPDDIAEVVSMLQSGRKTITSTDLASPIHLDPNGASSTGVFPSHPPLDDVVTEAVSTPTVAPLDLASRRKNRNGGSNWAGSSPTIDAPPVSNRTVPPPLLPRDSTTGLLENLDDLERALADLSPKVVKAQSPSLERSPSANSQPASQQDHSRPELEHVEEVSAPVESTTTFPDEDVPWTITRPARTDSQSVAYLELLDTPPSSSTPHSSSQDIPPVPSLPDEPPLGPALSGRLTSGIPGYDKESHDETVAPETPLRPTGLRKEEASYSAPLPFNSPMPPDHSQPSSTSQIPTTPRTPRTSSLKNDNQTPRSVQPPPPMPVSNTSHSLPPALSAQDAGPAGLGINFSHEAPAPQNPDSPPPPPLPSKGRTPPPLDLRQITTQPATSSSSSSAESPGLKSLRGVVPWRSMFGKKNESSPSPTSPSFDASAVNLFPVPLSNSQHPPIIPHPQPPSVIPYQLRPAADLTRPRQAPLPPSQASSQPFSPLMPPMSPSSVPLSARSTSTSSSSDHHSPHLRPKPSAESFRTASPGLLSDDEVFAGGNSNPLPPPPITPNENIVVSSPRSDFGAPNTPLASSQRYPASAPSTPAVWASRPGDSSRFGSRSRARPKLSSDIDNLLMQMSDFNGEEDDAKGGPPSVPTPPSHTPSQQPQSSPPIAGPTTPEYEDAQTALGNAFLFSSGPTSPEQ
ncbi:hypothetical protein T439DRAFT_377674 [Meredithblackwellia eburnea MCA 4105]